MPTPLQWTELTLRRFWDWQGKREAEYFTNHSGRRIAARLRPWLRGHRSVLDFGCGPGFLVPHLAALGLEVTATDHSASAVAATNARNKTVRGFVGAFEISALLASRKTFDAIISIEVIEHLDDAALSEFWSALVKLAAPGATVIITTPNAEPLAASEIYCPACDHTFHRWQHVRQWTASTLSEAVRGAGLSPIRVLQTNFALPRWRSFGTQHLACIASR